MARRLLLAVAATLAAALAPAGAAAQAGSCQLVSQEGPWTVVGDPATRVISASGPLLVRCTGGEELRADSAVIYQLSNEVHLFRRVDYQDPTRALTSDQAIYNSQTGRLYATGNVVFTDKNRGSTLTGPELEYYRVMEGRPEAQAIATGRPHLTVARRDEGTGRRREPMEIDGDRITSLGERFMTAEGNVVIVSDSVRSTAALAQYDQTSERLELRTDARVVGSRYELLGQYIETNLTEGSLSRVLARDEAQLIHERLRVDGPQLQLFFANDALERLVSSHAAEGGANANGRSVALAKGFRMEADSLQAELPGQSLREVHAIGTAVGEAWDTLAPPSVAAETASPTAVDPNALPLGQKDLLFADTIIGYFRDTSAVADSVAGDSAAAGAAPADTGLVVVGPVGAEASAAPRDTARAAGEPGDPEEGSTEIERMTALGNARSLYRVKDEARPERKPGINYLIGQRIDMTFAAGEVDVARVFGLQRGVYLDPLPARDSAAADSAAGDSAAPGRVTPPPPATAAPASGSLPGTPATGNRTTTPALPTRNRGGRP